MDKKLNERNQRLVQQARESGLLNDEFDLSDYDRNYLAFLRTYKECHQLPSTSHQLPSTSHQLPSISHDDANTSYDFEHYSDDEASAMGKFIDFFMLIYCFV